MLNDSKDLVVSEFDGGDRSDRIFERWIALHPGDDEVDRLGVDGGRRPFLFEFDDGVGIGAILRCRRKGIFAPLEIESPSVSNIDHVSAGFEVTARRNLITIVVCRTMSGRQDEVPGHQGTGTVKFTIERQCDSSLMKIDEGA